MPRRLTRTIPTVLSNAERIAKLEQIVADLQKNAEIQLKRIAAIQAELDHVRAATIGGTIGLPKLP